MMAEDNPERLKRSSRTVRPPVWQRDYVMAPPHSSATHDQGRSAGGAKAPNGNMDVKALSEEVMAMKGMLMDLGQMMRDMQPRSRTSSFETSSEESSPVAREGDPPVECRTSLVQELGECLRQHQENVELPYPLPPRISRQSSFPPPPPSMLITPSPQPHREPPELGPDVHPYAVPPAPHMENFNLQVPFNVNSIPEYQNQPLGVPQELSPVNDNLVNPDFYASDQRLERRNGLLQYNHMPGNAFFLPCPPCPPWVPPQTYPTFFQSGGFLRPPYLPYLPYGPSVYPEYVAPVAAVPQHPPAPPRHLLPSQIRAVASSSVPAGISAISAPPLHQAPAEYDPVRPIVEHTASQLGNVQCHPAADLNPTASVPQSQQVNDNQVYPPSRPYVAADSQMPVSLPNIAYPLPQSSRSARVKRPSFPFFEKDDPQEFAMLNMALENLIPPEETEQYKYHILLDHLKLDAARHLALAYAHHPQPYTTALKALQRKYGQPHHLVLREIASMQSLPSIRPGDSRGFSQFAVRIRALVGMLQSWGRDEGALELACASHVHQLLSKLPAEHVARFARHARTIGPDIPYNLIDFSNWLEEEAECQSLAVQVSEPKGAAKLQQRDAKFAKPTFPTTTFLQGVSQEDGTRFRTQNKSTYPRVKSFNESGSSCAFCDSRAHHLSQCPDFQRFDVERKRKWILDNDRCWRCGRTHHSSKCDLKRGCPHCKDRHLGILHEVNSRKRDSGIFYLSRPSGFNSVLLKVVKVILSYKERSLETYAILDDGSERTMLLSSAAESLGLNGAAESLVLRTIRQGAEEIEGATVSFSIAPASHQQKKYQIKGAFTAKQLDLPEQTYPVVTLQRRYQHLRDLPLQDFHKMRPMLLVGADHPHLLSSTERVRFGPPGSPAALHTRLGWTLHGPTSLVQETCSDTRCLFLASTATDQLQRDVERLWQVDVFPYSQSPKVALRSKQDHQAFECLEQRTKRQDINGIQRYATPLLRAKNAPLLQAPQDAVMPALRHTERQLSKNPERAAIYDQEVQKLIVAGYVKKLDPDEVDRSNESWYIPHHLVEHNGKHRLVFNCSYQFQGENLNAYLLPGPTLGPSLLGVLIRFREHAVAISGDIKGMFHQVRLLPTDRPLLRFLWRNMKRDVPPAVYEWQVLPFGTTCSPCCAIYALQRHAQSLPPEYHDVQSSVLLQLEWIVAFVIL